MAVQTVETEKIENTGGESLEELQARLDASPKGLDQTEVQNRLRRYGYNEIAEKKVNPFLKLLTYFWGPIPWMIEAAAVLSAVVRHWPDFTIIMILLLANAVVGFWEEYQAGNAIAALKARLALNARVLRDGRWTSVPARELVPGDVIRTRLGDIVPADARLLDEEPIEVDQSALTGESLPVTRKKGEAVYSGSIIRHGEVNALVYGTGLNTYFGKTAQLVQEADNVSHFHHPNPLFLLVHTPRKDFAGGRFRNPDVRHASCGLWNSDAADRLGMGIGRVGLCAAVVFGQRPDQIVGLPGPEYEPLFVFGKP
jgi:magnesium-transporting ATPase (P-type)